ncbi:MAG: hypothetical protein BGO69_14770 [Bacteroidetes bacterium 46-16]|nr:MAG: hypothetical protein BGO69_14770 [Bacteroidetes bacterium 46-16]
MTASLLRIFQCETDKKAANVLRAKLTGKPKDYGIMALLVPHKPTLRDLFRFLLVFRFTRTVYLLSFFPFFLLENALWGRRREKKTNEQNGLTIKIQTS